MESEKSSREKGIYKVTIVGSIVNFLLLVLNSLPELPGIVRLCWPMLSTHYPISSPILLSLSLSALPGNRRIRVTITAMANTKPWLRPSSGCYFCVSVSVSFGMGLRPFILLRGGQLESPGVVALVAALVSIVSKEILYQYTVIQGKKLNSQAVIANAWHHRSDALSSIGTAIGIGGAILLGDHWRVLDPVAAVVVSFFIMKVSVRLLIPCVDELLEKSLPEDVEKEIEQTVLSFPG